ncbi:uncharacterized protein [Montipora capricornis]|uniref:uncharacterized protein isoform X2 n=1 Tax=Montipora capricornis TaxID=246305 RepID=UPI0035F13B2C
MSHFLCSQGTKIHLFAFSSQWMKLLLFCIRGATVNIFSEIFVLIFMDVKEDVVVYQVDRSSPCAECRALLDPLEVTTNLLLEGERAHNFTVVSSNAFKPLHDSKSLVPLVFKFEPPKLSLDSCQSSDSNSQTLIPKSCHFKEFMPVYSGKSSLRPKPGKCNYPKPQDLCNADNIPKTCSVNHAKSVAVPDDKEETTRAEEHDFNLTVKSLWCASPFVNQKTERKDEELVLGKFSTTYLHNVKEKHGLGNHQRGKWVLQKTEGSIKGKKSTLEMVWRKVRSLIKEGHLPHCNSKLQKTHGEVWIYCDFQHSLKS